MVFINYVTKMNEDKNKIRVNKKGQLKTGLRNNFVKPCGKFWKRYFNKKVRKGYKHKRGNWFDWC